MPVDFSEQTGISMQYGLEIVRQFGGEIRLLHCYLDYVALTGSNFDFSYETEGFLNYEMLNSIRESSRQNIIKIQEQLQQKVLVEGRTDIHIHYTLSGGIADEEILNIAETYKPDLILMGSRGKGGKAMLSGSVVARIVKESTFPIIIVPEQGAFKSNKRFLFATKFSTEDLQSILSLIELSQPVGGDLFCVHVDIDGDRETDQLKMAELQDALKYIPDNITMHFEIIDNRNIVDGIEAFVKKHEITMICLVNHKRTFWQRMFEDDTTRKFLYKTKTPLIIFPEME